MFSCVRTALTSALNRSENVTVRLGAAGRQGARALRGRPFAYLFEGEMIAVTDGRSLKHHVRVIYWLQDSWSPLPGLHSAPNWGCAPIPRRLCGRETDG